jgi:hypothetical protein
VSKLSQEAATNLERVKADIEEGLESAKRLVEQTKVLLSAKESGGQAGQV